MIAFPSNPALNDTYTAAGKTWLWNGTAWQLQPRVLTSADITDFAEAVVDAAPPTTDADLLTSGTLDDARLSAEVTASLALADTALQPGAAIADISGLQTALDGKQASGDYATLVGGLVPASQLPSFVDDVLEFSNLAGFPATGESGKIYVDTSTAKTYRWSGSVYVEISASPGSTDAVPEGSTNLYHTTQRAADAAPVQSVAGRTGNVTLASTDITDFGSAVATAAPAPTTPANSGLAITGNSLATSYNSTIADGVVSVSVGGAPAAPASAWKAKSLVQVLDDILFPTLLASVGSAKSINLAVSGASGTLEIGSSHSRTLTATFTRGTILDGNGSTNANPLVGAASTYTFTGTGISSTAQSGNELTFTAAVVSGTNNWAVTSAHAAGTGSYFDNKGVAGTNLDAQRAASTATDSTSAPAITGVHPYYYLKSASPISAADMVAAIQNGTATKVVAASTGTLSIPYSPSAEYLAVAYPSTSTTKTRYYVTALDNGAITVVFQPVATQTVTTALWSQSYRIHVSGSALTNSNATIELRNS